MVNKKRCDACSRENLHSHRIPKQEFIAKKWIKNLELKDVSKDARICNNHFRCV